ncbi:MAG: hypothetical protein ACEQR8_07870, partial [Cypionkella sp.]
MAAAGAVLARARTDASDRLIEADEPLAGLQRRCGGDLPGVVAIPQLLEAVRKARTSGLRLARTIEALDGEETVRAWVEIAPDDRPDGGCGIAIGAWSARARQQPSEEDVAQRRLTIDRALAELTVRLDPQQRMLTVDSSAPDLSPLARQMRAQPGTHWTEFVTLPDLAHAQPLHWRLLDGARCIVAGSARGWTVTLVPFGVPEPGSAGFELLLVADAPLPAQGTAPAAPELATPS